MRLFLTLCSLAAIAYAKPQGYNYGSGISGTIGTGSIGVGTGFLGAPSTGGTFGKIPSGGYTGGGGFTGSTGFSGQSSSTFNTGVSGFGSGGSGGFGTGGAGFNTGAAHFEAPLVHKQFITISAPDDHDNLEQSKHLVLGRPQKNYRVVFIKAPSSSNANVKLSAEYAPKEEKTVIYVLTKKDSALEVNDIATPEPTVPSKPEVFFIKYKTEDEAQHAQRQIQAEYDKIEGTSEHTDGGVAPQQSVVGILGGAVGGGSIGGGSIGGGSISGSGLGFSSGSSGLISAGSSGSSGSTYLPPAKVI